MSENTDAKFLGNFQKLIGFVEGDAGWQPSNPALTAAAMAGQREAGANSAAALAAAVPAYKNAVNEREIAYQSVFPAVITRSLAIYKSSGATPQAVEDAKSAARKLTGKRKSPKIADDPTTPADESSLSNSTANLSYDSLLGNLRGYIEILTADKKYAPNETELKTVALNAAADNLAAKNEAVADSFVPLANARLTRDRSLYDAPDSIFNTAKLAKAYAKGVYGSKDTRYTRLAALEFKRPNRS